MAGTDETPTRPGWHIGLALLGLLVLLLLRNVAASRSPTVRETTDLSGRTLQALTSVKYAFALREAAPQSQPETRRSAHRRGTFLDKNQVKAEDEAVADWRKIATEIGRPGAWRRLGITLFLFGRPGGMDAFHNVYAPSTAPSAYQRSPDETAKQTAAETARTGLTPAQETVLWETLYGSRPLDKRQVASLRASLARLHLGWFENIAAAQLYEKAGDHAAAQRALSRARDTAEYVNLVEGVQAILIFLGLGGLLVAGVRALRPRRSLWDWLTLASPPFLTRNIRLVAFVIYLLMMNLVGLPGLWLRSLTRAWSEATLFHVLLIAQLVLYVPIVAVPLLIARRMASRRLPPDQPLSWGNLMEALGLRVQPLGRSFQIGILRYAMTLPFFLAAAWLSHFLFRHVPTPNPVQTDILLAQSPADRLLLLITAAVAAPLVEETFFRGLLYGALRESWGVWGGAALSAAIFALVHPTLPAGFLPLWVLGFSFALTYQRYGSLLPNIVMHGLHNALILWLAFAVLSH